MRYVNMFGFFLLFVSTGLTVCYCFRLLNFVLCGDFNFVLSYSMVETCRDTHMSFHLLLFNPVKPHSSPSSVHTPINTLT